MFWMRNKKNNFLVRTRLIGNEILFMQPTLWVQILGKEKKNEYDFLILNLDTFWVLNDTVTGSFEYQQHRFSFFLSLYTARPSFEYYRQVYFVHSGF